MPPTSLGPLPGLPAMMSPFWPMLQHQMHGRMPHPLNFGQQFNPNLAGLSPMGLKINDRKMSPVSGQKSPSVSPFKCNFCSFIGTSQEVLTSHVMKVHATENQDLFSMFGLSSELLLEDGKKRAAALNMNLKSPPRNIPQFDLANIKKESTERSPTMSDFDRRKMSPFAHLNNKLMNESQTRDEGIDILKQMTLKFGSGPVDLKRKRPSSSSAALSFHNPVSSIPSSIAMSSMGASSDSPLDLTKPRSPAEQFSNGNEDGEHSSGENSVYSNDISSPQPRKRSRKGKAFKLDTLCMKLQEKHGNMCESEEESDGNTSEIYRPELLPEPDDIDDDTVGKDMNDNKHDDEIKQRKSSETEIKEFDEIDKFEENGGEEKGFPKNKMNGEKQTLDLSKADNDWVNVDRKKLAHEESEDDLKEEDSDIVTSTYISDENNSTSPSSSGNPSRRKPVPAAIQRGADIAWKILNEPQSSDTTKLLLNGGVLEDNIIEMTPLDKKLWNEAPECISQSQRTEKGEYKCMHCRITFADCIMYTMHMGYHGYKDPYKCNLCGDTCRDRVEFFLHIARAAHN